MKDPCLRALDDIDPGPCVCRKLCQRRSSGREVQQTLVVELGRIHKVSLTGLAGGPRQLTEPTETQMQIFTECGVPLPPKADALEPATTR